VDARSTATLTQFVDSEDYKSHLRDLKASTQNGYSKLWNKHLKSRVGAIALRDFRTLNAANVLSDLRMKGLGRRSLQHAKSLLSGIFTVAKSRGWYDGLNPVQGALIPKRAKVPQETHAATPEEVLDMLDALRGKPHARAAIALMYFGGLRPGEARGARWEDLQAHYDDARDVFEWRLTPRQSVWRTHVGTPKTEGSAKPVPAIETLRAILAELRDAEGNPQTGPILRGERCGRPLNLDNLARREVKPALNAKGIPWHGWYALRRGIGTQITADSKDPLAAKGMLRHESVATTQAHYIKDVPENTRHAMQGVEQRIQKLVAKRREQQSPTQEATPAMQ
jgi:integrase